MPTVVANVDGKTVRITVPAGATQAEIEAMVEDVAADVRAKAAPAEAEAASKPQAGRDYDDLSGENALVRGAAGFARPIVETLYGAKQLVGKGLKAVGVDTDMDQLTPEQQRVLNNSRQDLGTAGTVGRVAGEVATFAVPGGAAGKVASKVAATGARGARLAPAVADISTAVAVEGAKAPTAEQDRVDAMIYAALGAGVGRAVVSSLGVALRGLDPTEQAKRLAQFASERGIKLRMTPGQIKDGLVQSVEDVGLSRVPVAAQLVARQKKQALQDWNRAVLTDVAPKAADGSFVPVAKSGGRGLSEAAQKFKTRYDEDIYGIDPSYSKDLAEDLVYTVQEQARGLPARFQRAFNQDAQSIIGPLDFESGGVAVAKKLQAADDLLRKRIRAANVAGNGDLAAAYAVLRDKSSTMLGDAKAGLLRAADAQYAKYATVRKAALGQEAAKHGGVFTPGELMGKTPKLVGKEGDLRHSAEVAGDVLGYGRESQHWLEQILGAGALGVGISPAAILAPAVTALIYNRGTGALLQPRHSVLATALVKAAKARGESLTKKDAWKAADQIIGRINDALRTGRAAGSYGGAAINTDAQEEDDGSRGMSVLSVEEVKR